MTKREFFELVSTTIENEDAKAIAVAELERINKETEKAAAKRAEKKAEDAPLYEAIVSAILTEEPMTTTDIAAILNVHTSKASALLRKLVETGEIEVTDVKVPKKGTQKAYSLKSATSM